MPKVQNIFIVDNSEVALKSMAKIFKETSFNVNTYSNPHEALYALDHISPDIILLDYFMPEMTGAEFMVKVSERLLQNPNWQVYLVSSHEFEEEELMSMLTLGITKVFNKPLKKQDVFAAIEQYEAL